MSEEMQAAEPAVEQSNIALDSEPVEQAEEPSESSADTGENQEQKVTFSDEQQAVFNKKIGEQTFKRREAQRQAEGREADLKRQLDELQTKLPTEQRPDVPKVPDRYDFDDDTAFSQAMQTRDTAIQDAVRFDARASAQVEQQQLVQQQQAAQQQQALNESVQAYSARATQLGIKPEELQQAGNVIATFGVNDTVIRAILADEQGPLITKYLATNAAALDSLSKLDPVSAGIALASIKIEASKLIASKPTAPDPVESISGAGGRPKKLGGNHSYE